MQHRLPPLPYARDALEPHMSAETLDLHHGKHHQAYVTQLNKLVVGTEFEGSDLETIVRNASGALFNQAAQVWNHTFFFDGLSADGVGSPSATLAAATAARWGDAAGFEAAFAQQATAVFGSGWTWLVRTPSGSLDIVSTANAATPLTTTERPLMVLDVWEHAYYIDHRNLRARYIETFLHHLVNWRAVSERWQAAARPGR
ncbi:MAG: superoxide dismutase [Burkholderiales bacterium]